jgi:hypothetical protein
LTAAPLGEEIVVIATSRELPPRPRGLPSGVEAHLLGGRSPLHGVIEAGGAAAPAIATTNDRIAVAYVLGAQIHLALLDRNLERIGDALTIAPVENAPAVAFVGDEVVVFWTDDRGGKTRLTSSSFAPGTTAASPPKVAIDEPLGPRRPITARLPNGSSVVAWVAAAGGVSTLRVSPIGPGGALAGPTDIGKAAAVDGLRATTTDKGIDFSWYESESMVRIARVTCGDRAR